MQQCGTWHPRHKRNQESVYRVTKWVVFEPNGEELWAQILSSVGAFLHRLFRKGAFVGATREEAYLVKCDEELFTRDEINQGIVKIDIGFAPFKPAEFVFIHVQQFRNHT